MAAHILTIDELNAHLASDAVLFGLDLGTKTIGIAVSDTMRRFATPLLVIQRIKFGIDAEALLKHAAERKVAAFILGLPLNMDGSEGPRAQATRAFARNLAPKTDIPIVFWDERLSTVAAERTLIEADLSRAKRKAVIDSAAAAFILQGVLDRLAHMVPVEHDDFFDDPSQG